MSSPEWAIGREGTPSQQRKANWPLRVGSVFVVFILFLAIAGPSLAPNDPREQKTVIQVNGKWMTPPYPAFTPGYLLGSDNLGRDLYSWLLWSVRPTLILVVVVALIRLAVGLVVGVGAGWSDGWWARRFDGLISAALSVPALIAALIVITALGFHLGVLSFVVGLAITGWAEVAQLVREQTRTIKGQQAVEAAHALGASSGQIFFLHILPQVMPMIWMLLAVEISSTLVTTAGLGFLGYYLGGAVFTEVGDFVYQRIAEMPELGQMLATVWLVLDEPWAMVAAGTVVFFIVLTFNLISEGFQRRLTRQLGGPRELYTVAAGDVLPWLNDRIGELAANLMRHKAFRALAVLGLVLAVGSGWVWWRGHNAPVPNPGSAMEAGAASTLPTEEGNPAQEMGGASGGSRLSAPGGHIWANEGHDPWRTRRVDFTGPVTSTIRWVFEGTDGFTGGPAIDAQGILYVGSKDGTVYALEEGGKVRWEALIEARPVGSPALAPDGAIYVATREGVSALSPAGEVLWNFSPADGKAAAAGPIVGPDGIIYYKSVSELTALSPAGSLLWHTPITETGTAILPLLSPDGHAVFWTTMAFNSADGSPYDWGDILRPSSALSQIVVGADGKLYHRYDAQLVRVAPSGVALEEALVFDWSALARSSSDAGITPDGSPWLIAYPTTGYALALFRGTPEGKMINKLSLAGWTNVEIVGVDSQNVMYLCGGYYDAFSSCVAQSPEFDGRLWRITLSGVKAISGAALGPDRLYVATWDGRLFAIGEELPAPGGF